jgi:predicted transcriptional regulator
MITVTDIAEALGAEVVVMGNQKRPIRGCYISDLLSDVMAKANEGDLWITLQTHTNIVAVSIIKGISAIMLTNGRRPEEETAKRAEKEGMPILVYQGSTFEAAGKVYLILRGT